MRSSSTESWPEFRLNVRAEFQDPEIRINSATELPGCGRDARAPECIHYTSSVHVWRERLGRWFGPIALRIPVSPNTISVVALLIVATAAWMISQGLHQPRFFLWALPLIFLGGLLDAIDGIVARVQNRQSRFGDFLDHCLDRVSDTLLTVGWGLGTGIRTEILLASVLTVLFNGYVGTQLEATFGRRTYEGTGRGEFVLALFIFPTAAYVLATSGLLSTKMAGLTVPEWMTLVLTAFALFGIIQRFRMAHRLSQASDT